MQHQGPNFAPATGAQEQSCLPQESGTESFPGRKSWDARVEPQETWNRPGRAAERWDAGIGGPGGWVPEPRLSVCARTLSIVIKLQCNEHSRGFILSVCRSPDVGGVRSEKVAPALRLVEIALFPF